MFMSARVCDAVDRQPRANERPHEVCELGERARAAGLAPTVLQRRASAAEAANNNNNSHFHYESDASSPLGRPALASGEQPVASS